MTPAAVDLRLAVIEKLANSLSPPLRSRPEKFHEDKSEILHEVKQLRRDLFKGDEAVRRDRL